MCGRGIHAWQGVCMTGVGDAWQGGDVHGRRHAWQGHVWQGWGMCMAGVRVYIVRSVHGRGVQGRGHAWQGGACMAGEMATAAEGMHPTGIHSCFLLHSHFPVCDIYITGKIRGEDAV